MRVTINVEFDDEGFNIIGEKGEILAKITDGETKVTDEGLFTFLRKRFLSYNSTYRKYDNDLKVEKRDDAWFEKEGGKTFCVRGNEFLWSQFVCTKAGTDCVVQYNKKWCVAQKDSTCKFKREIKNGKTKERVGSV